MQRRPAKSLWHNLGALFGNIAAGVAADPRRPPMRLLSDAERARVEAERQQGAQGMPAHPHARARTQPAPAAATPEPILVKQIVQEASVAGPNGRVVLRRTVTDEIVPPNGFAG
ncbi:hypothetical protein BH11PLA1_BH11PLA1_00090 [soil metagenome]